MDIESAGRHKDGSLYVNAKDHQLVQRPSGRIDRDYHGDGSIAQTYSKPWKPCCEEFEKQARFELSGLQLLNEMMSDLEE